MDGAVPADIAREKQQQLARQLAALQDQQAQVSRVNASQEEILTGTIRLIANCGEVYNNAGNNLRRLYNQAWFNRITVDAEYEDASCSPERTELMETLHRSAHALYETHGPAGPADSTHKHEKRAESLCSRLVPHDYGSTGSPLVERTGLEPATGRLVFIVDGAGMARQPRPSMRAPASHRRRAQRDDTRNSPRRSRRASVAYAIDASWSSVGVRPAKGDTTAGVRLRPNTT
jgi:hypothetical protein